jgi:hypothetical protein
MSLYNVIFTVLPPLVIGIFDQDVDREMSHLYPGKRPSLICLLLYHHELLQTTIAVEGQKAKRLLSTAAGSGMAARDHETCARRLWHEHLS